MRIVSLLPSATELLCTAGGADVLVGRSHECDWPLGIVDRPILTLPRTRLDAPSAEIDAQVRAQLRDASPPGLYTLDERRLRELKPDLILTQDLCQVCSVDLRTVERVAGAMRPKPRVLRVNPTGLDDVFDDLLRIGAAIDRRDAAEAAVVALRQRYFAARDFVNAYLDGPETLVLEWVDPPFVGGHWTPQLIEAAGGRHSLNPPGAPSRSPAIDEIVAAQPERVIIAPCGHSLDRIERDLPALQAQRWWNALPAVVAGNVAIVDGSHMFNRPGPRLVDAFEWLVGWLNGVPQLTPPAFPWKPIGSGGVASR